MNQSVCEVQRNRFTVQQICPQAMSKTEKGSNQTKEERQDDEERWDIYAQSQQQHEGGCVWREE